MTDAAAPLLDEIRKAGAAAATAAIAAATAKADTMRAGARDRAARERTDAVAAHEIDAATALARTRAETAARVGRGTLTARASALDRVFAEADRRFASITSHPALGELVGATVDDALTYLPPGPAIVACSAGVADSTRAALTATGRENVTLRVDEAVPALVRIEAGDGSVVVDATFARRLARERPRLSTIVARRLVGDAT